MPRFVQGILQRYDTMIERSASELAAMGECPIKPYRDPRLRASSRELRRLMVQLAGKGLVTFRTGVKEKIGIFCVRKKTPRWKRLIINTRRANWAHMAHRPPPCTRLATPRAFLDIQFDKPSNTGACAYGMEADVADCFYNFVCESTESWFGIGHPLTCKQWQEPGWNATSIYSDKSGGFFHPSSDDQLYPVFRGLCMGCAWALFLANEAVAFIVSGYVERPIQEVRDRMPCLDVSSPAATGVYVDNISIIGPTMEPVRVQRDIIREPFGKLGIPLTRSADEPSTILQTIGVVFDFEHGIARNQPRRLWRAFLAGKELLRRRLCGCVGEVAGTHDITVYACPGWLVLLLQHLQVHPAVQGQKGGALAVDQRRDQDELGVGLACNKTSSLIFEPVHQVDAGDASGSAYALLTTWASFAEISDVCRWREAWRFRPLPQQAEKLRSLAAARELLKS